MRMRKIGLSETRPSIALRHLISLEGPFRYIQPTLTECAYVQLC